MLRSIGPGMLWLGGFLAVMPHQPADANCGASFCMVNTNWNLQGMAVEPGLRLDFRYEFIKQNKPMAGSRKVAVGQIPQDHDEVKTINRNAIGTLDYTIDDKWSVAATVPVVNRSHIHLDNESGTPTPERWHLTRLGDIRILGRYQQRAENKERARLSFYGVNFGLKLPTGAINVRNADGARAERTLQPGTGTTDLLLGGYFNQVLPAHDSSWFVQGLWQSALTRHEEFKPGNRWTLDAGYRYEASANVGLMLQLNALIKRRDSGLQAEPEHSGGKFLFLSPGISYSLTKTFQVYGFVQKPLYQYVNGVQLAADWSAVAGVSARF
jgi:hypothetical protein